LISWLTLGGGATWGSWGVELRKFNLPRPSDPPYSTSEKKKKKKKQRR